MRSEDAYTQKLYRIKRALFILLVLYISFIHVQNVWLLAQVFLPAVDKNYLPVPIWKLPLISSGRYSITTK